jgi:hypothetical protein
MTRQVGIETRLDFDMPPHPALRYERTAARRDETVISEEVRKMGTRSGVLAEVMPHHPTTNQPRSSSTTKKAFFFVQP